MPIQPAGAREAIGMVVIDPVYEAGLQDLEAQPKNTRPVLKGTPPCLKP